jgi:3-hydroxybutyrate dehydrogenase
VTLDLSTIDAGINLEFARLLLEAGANVVFADLALRPEAQSLVDRFSKKAIFVVTDVTSWIALQALFDRAIHKFGQIDVVCPGAGLFEPSFSNFWIPPGTGSSRDRPDGDRYKTVDVNFTHPVRLTQMAISHFLSQDPRAYFLNTLPRPLK